MISAQGITKRFGQLTAVDQVSFEIGRGELVGFIGPNGAGKTTTMRVLTGFLPASAGRAVVAGADVFEDPMTVRRKVGYLPETPPLYPELTIGDYLRFVAEIREVERSSRTRCIGEVMEKVGLAGWERRILGSLSKGYRQRVGLAQAVLHDPEVLVLDEPTSGLDPGQVAGIRDFMRELAEERTVILSTHILTEVELLAQRAVIIADGRVIADDTIDGLRNNVGRGVRYRIELAGPDDVSPPVATQVGALEAVTQVTPLAKDDGFDVMDVKSETDPRTEIARLATTRRWSIRAMERHSPSLEEAFLDLVGQER